MYLISREGYITSCIQHHTPFISFISSFVHHIKQFEESLCFTWQTPRGSVNQVFCMTNIKRDCESTVICLLTVLC